VSHEVPGGRYPCRGTDLASHALPASRSVSRLRIPSVEMLS